MSLKWFTIYGIVKYSTGSTQYNMNLFIRIFSHSTNKPHVPHSPSHSTICGWTIMLQHAIPTCVWSYWYIILLVFAIKLIISFLGYLISSRFVAFEKHSYTTCPVLEFGPLSLPKYRLTSPSSTKNLGKILITT
jgi:hypothetical protein